MTNRPIYGEKMELSAEEQEKKKDSLLPISCKIIFSPEQDIDCRLKDPVIVNSHCGYTNERVFDLPDAYRAINCRNGQYLGVVEKQVQWNLLPTYGIDVFFLGVVQAVSERYCEVQLSKCKSIHYDGKIQDVSIQDKLEPISVNNPNFYVQCPVCGKYTNTSHEKGQCPDCGNLFSVAGVRYQQVRLYVEDVWLDEKKKYNIYRYYAMLRRDIDSLLIPTGHILKKNN